MSEQIIRIFVSSVLAAGLYFLPSIIGGLKKKRNTGAIIAVNFFLGWTVLGWIVALVWALTYEPERTKVQ